MRTIICTTGTSIARGCPSLRGYQVNPRGWDEPATDLAKDISERLEALDLTAAPDRVRAAAELNSLHRLGVSPEDRIVLLATDTADGRACAEAVIDSLCAGFGIPGENIVLKRVEGLQVHDPELLRRTGLFRFTEQVLDIVNDPQARYGGEIVINPTGGYKGVVPFLTVIGMLFRLRCIYVFEFAESLIELPPLPVAFDLTLFNRALPALDSIEDAGGSIPEEQYFRAIENFSEYERDLFGGFVEVDCGQAFLSPLSFVFLQLDKKGARNVFLSPAAKSLMDGVTGLERARLERMLSRVGHPLWRSIHFHSFKGTDLDVFKPGDVPERLAGIVREDGVYVCRLYLDHDEYESDLPGRRRSDFDNLGEFEPWDRSANGLAKSNETIEQGLLATIDSLEEDRGKLQVKVREAGGRYRDEIRQLKPLAGQVPGLRKGLDEARQKVKTARRKCRERDDRIAAMEAELAVLRGELKRLRPKNPRDSASGPIPDEGGAQGHDPTTG